MSGSCRGFVADYLIGGEPDDGPRGPIEPDADDIFERASWYLDRNPDPRRAFEALVWSLADQCPLGDPDAPGPDPWEQRAAAPFLEALVWWVCEQPEEE